MLGPPYIEDYFVLSSVHDYPLRVLQLEGYIHHFICLIENSLPYVRDEKTIEFLQRAVQNARKSWENLGEIFFREAKAKLGFPENACYWPKDFPTLKILGKPEVRCFTVKDIEFFTRKKEELRETIRKLCDTYNPLLLIAIPTIQMENVAMPKNPEVEVLFKRVWTQRKIPSVDLEKISKHIFRTGLRQFEEKLMDESYRQVFLTETDLQREIRRRLCDLCSQGEGTETWISEYTLLQLMECLYTDISLDFVVGAMEEFNLPILVLEDDQLSLFVNVISKQDTLPFQEQLNERQKRYLLQFVDSKTAPEEDIPQLYFLNESLSENESELLSFLTWQIGESNSKMILFPRKSSGKLFSEPLQMDEEIVDEWIEGDKSPFVKVLWKGKRYCLTTRNILEDKLFRISWRINQAVHPKLRGNKYEDFVLHVLKELFPDALTEKNRFFWGEYKGKRKKLEIDRIFAMKEFFFLLECKNLSLIENTSDIRKLKSRQHELENYGDYLESKATQLISNLANRN